MLASKTLILFEKILKLQYKEVENKRDDKNIFLLIVLFPKIHNKTHTKTIPLICDPLLLYRQILISIKCRHLHGNASELIKCRYLHDNSSEMQQQSFNEAI